MMRVLSFSIMIILIMVIINRYWQKFSYKIPTSYTFPSNPFSGAGASSPGVSV